MILRVYGNKIKATYCFDVTSKLIKIIIIFCWWIMVRMMMLMENLQKIYDTISFMEGALPPPIKGKFQAL